MKRTRIYTDEQLLARRRSGELPEIDIAGAMFQVDWPKRELRAIDDPAKKISLEYMPMDEKQEHYLCLYHIPSMSVLVIGDDTVCVPDNTVLLRIPNQLTLDPVGVAREYGLKDTAILDTYPLRQQLKAEVLALNDTAVPDFLYSNKKKAEQRNHHESN